MNYQGKLLISHPKIQDGIFAKSVVFVYRHTDEGSLGVILNKPSTWTVREFMKTKKVHYPGDEVMYKGGPVNKYAVILLHEDKWESTSTIRVCDGIAMSSDEEMVERIARNDAPKSWRMFVGISAWSSNQLDLEVNAPHGWQVLDASRSIMLNSDTDYQWNTAIQWYSQKSINNFF